MRQVNQATLNMIKDFEGFEPKAYLDIVGVPTIGYGTTVGVTKEDVANGRTISKHEAEGLLMNNLAQHEKWVSQYVTIPVNDNQFGALVSFCYNLGPGSLSKSTLLKLLNAGNISGAADEFLKWNKAGGVPIAGLTRRREAERSLFLQSVPSDGLPNGPSDQDIEDKLKDIEKEI